MPRPQKKNIISNSNWGLKCFLGLNVLLLAAFAYWIIENGQENSQEEQTVTQANHKQAASIINVAQIQKKEANSEKIQPRRKSAPINMDVDAAQINHFNHKIKPFLKTYCIDCHGKEKQKGKRRFDTLIFPIKDNDALVDYQDVLDLLNLSEMPPEDEKQPPMKEKMAVIDWLTDAIDQAHKARKSTGGETVLRRINRREYRHTIGDLFHLNMLSFDPTTTFPDEVKDHHLDNQAHALVTSGFLLDQYIRAADKVIEKVLPANQDLLKPPAAKTWVSRGPYRHRQFEYVVYNEAFEKGIKREYYDALKKYNPKRHRGLKKRFMTQENMDEKTFDQLAEAIRAIPSQQRLYEFPKSDRLSGAYGYMPNFTQGVPYSGYYEVSLTATTKDRTNASQENAIGSDLSIPMILSIVPGDKRLGDLQKPQPVEPILYTKGLMGDNTSHDIKTRIWLERGQTPRFNWRNGAHKVRNDSVTWARKYMRKNKIPWFKKEVGYASKFVRFSAPIMHIPHIRLDDIQVKGPLVQSWPTPTMKLLLGGERFDPGKTQENLHRLMPRAFRREVSLEEVHSIMHFIKARERLGKSPYEAYKDGLKAILCSPSFLYMEENLDKRETKQISQVAMANRLSYYLWSSMPDKALMDAARNNELTTVELELQIERMLEDPRSDRLIEGLLDGWLTLNGLNSVLPDRNFHPDFYTDELPVAMREETRLYLRHMLDENRPITHFINSNYSFANYALAKHYGLDETFNDHTFRKVNLKGTPRGGLLGQASVMTVTANGVETSPVIRGIWLLENFLGTPPPPPPPDVEPLDPDVRGAKTIRERLEKHRTDPTCAECHRKIDPLGFALENFDPTGKWRTRYPKNEGGGKVDAHGKMPNTTAFKNFGDFKNVLMKDQAKIAKGLTEKLMAYALGRPVEITDRPEIDAILKDLKKNKSGFRYLIKRIALSPQFRLP